MIIYLRFRFGMAVSLINLSLNKSINWFYQTKFKSKMYIICLLIFFLDFRGEKNVLYNNSVPLLA